jgi:radical SAM superfamily enzyme YgiQ (UPF0313 family)
VLLLRPDPGNERFGLGPFFRVEPLGLEYIAAGLLRGGHETTLADLRLRPRLETVVRRARPDVVGISVLHALEFDQVLALARAVRRLVPGATIIAGGHAAAAHPAALEDPAIDYLVTDDGEDVVPALVGALAAGRSPDEVPALRLRTPDGWRSSPPIAERIGLDHVPLPARHLIDGYRSDYCCLQYRPVWLVETARGCPYRCSFCSVWQLYDRSFRERGIHAVADDFESAGPNIFIVDDLFWNHPARSLELAQELRHRGVHKRWILVQSRCDLVARHAELLAAWRPIADYFDIFFGFEAPTQRGLDALQKDAGPDATIEAAAVARSLDYGVTGNFVIDPDWDETRFEELWDFVQQHRLQRAGYTILTPLPGTAFFDEMKPVLAGQPWFKFDMHHLLWEPRLGRRRFFELYAETWRRSVLHLGGQKRFTHWLRQIRPTQIPFLTRILLRTQRLMDVDAYLRENVGPLRRFSPNAASAGP